MVAKYEIAKDIWEAAPGDVEAIIWYGRRTAYLGRYQEAIRIYSAGIELHPEEARLYRHRGHRLITTRQLENAIADLEHAVWLIEGTEDEVEPDGLPNELEIPVSTLHSNIWYHLGLAYYLAHDWHNAWRAYQAGYKAGRNDDNRVSTTHWRYMILRRMGEVDQAVAILDDISADMDIIENHVYHRLLLFYKGEISAEDVSEGGADNPTNSAAAYGIANWHYYNGDQEEGLRRMRAHLESDSWAAFGYIAAEADVAATQ